MNMNDYKKILIMKTLQSTLSILLLLIVASCNKENKTIPTEEPTTFNPDNYSEYMTCKVGDFSFNTGNSAGNTSSIATFKVGKTLYITNSDGNFISGNLASMEINMQLKDFDPVNPKLYEVSGTYPTEILKYKHIDGDNYDANNGTNITPQPNAIKITKIENGYYTGTFAFTTYKVANRATTLAVSQGSFKFKYIIQ
jgi:hypothetical protein